MYYAHSVTDAQIYRSLQTKRKKKTIVIGACKQSPIIITLYLPLMNILIYNTIVYSDTLKLTRMHFIDSRSNINKQENYT